MTDPIPLSERDDPDAPPVSVPGTILATLRDAGTVTHPLLVATTHAETDAAPWMIRTTIRRLDECGTIENVTGDDTNPRWKVTADE